jgi:hypothetical protein
MLLCISGVSYGADVGTTTNSDEITLTSDYDVTVEIVSTTDFTYSYESSYDVDSYSIDFIASTPLTIRLEHFDNRIDHNYVYLNNYKSHLATAPEPDQSVGIYPSNHIGKLLAGNASMTNSGLNYNRNTTHVGKPYIKIAPNPIK